MTTAQHGIAQRAHRLAVELAVPLPRVQIHGSGTTNSTPLAEALWHRGHPQITLSPAALSLTPLTLDFLLAHELAHFSPAIAAARRRRRRTVAAVALLGGLSIVLGFPDAQVLPRILAGVLMTAMLFWVIDNRLNRAEEFACDQRAADVVGLAPALEFLTWQRQHRPPGMLSALLGAHPRTADRLQAIGKEEAIDNAS